jgi:hypothetical protein
MVLFSEETRARIPEETSTVLRICNELTPKIIDLWFPLLFINHCTSEVMI